MNKKYFIALLIIGALILIGCNESSNPIVENSDYVPLESSWREFPLTDVRTGENFKISDFQKPVLLESFAVWCPTCTRQQQNIKKLHDEVGEEIVSISLDTDPNEDSEIILDHIQQNGFDWLYAVSPAQLTQALIDEFGIGFVNAPSAPVVLICTDGLTRKLSSGVKSVSELKKEIESGC